jgi:hypothetical protein
MQRFGAFEPKKQNKLQCKDLLHLNKKQIAMQKFAAFEQKTNL